MYNMQALSSIFRGMAPFSALKVGTSLDLPGLPRKNVILKDTKMERWLSHFPSK